MKSPNPSGTIPVTSYAATDVQVITPPALRGQMAAVSAIFLVAIGGLGPSVVAALTDFVFHDEKLVGITRLRHDRRLSAGVRLPAYRIAPASCSRSSAVGLIAIRGSQT